MLKEREHVLARTNQLLQTSITILSFVIVKLLLHYDNWQDSFIAKEFNSYLLLVGLLSWITIEYSGLHMMSREERYHEIFFKYIKVNALFSGLLFFASFLLETPWLNIQFVIIFAAINISFQYSFKAIFFSLMQLFRRKGYNIRQLIIFADDDSSAFIEELLTIKDWGYRIQSIITNSDEIKRKYGSIITILDSDVKVDKLFDEGVVDEVLFAKGNIDYQEINPLMIYCAERGIVFRLRPVISVRYGLKPAFTIFNDHPLFIFRNIPENYLALKIKRIIDLLIAISALIVAAPMLLIIAAIIKLDDGGPIFFTQERVGLYGRRFTCFKFRTMVINAESLKSSLVGQNEQDGPVFKMRLDPRVTKVGRFLRKYSLDEFPQFMNVMNGDMSVVGPRPPLPEEVNQYKKFQNRRLSMKPGITCIWQISGRNQVDFKEWVKMDMEYIDTWSLKKDLMIILKTIKVVTKGDGM